MDVAFVRPLPETADLARLRADAARAPHGFLLDSGADGWSFLGFAPRWILESRGSACRWVRDGIETLGHEEALSALQSGLSAWQLQAGEGMPPFWGGAVGYLAYDLGRQFERLPDLCTDDLGMPDMVWGFHDVVVAVPPSGQPLLCITPAPGETQDMLAAKRADWERRLSSLAPVKRTPGLRATAAPRSNFTPEAYHQAVERILAHLAAGDLYQANLSQRFTFTVAGDAHAWYEELRNQNPAPFAAFLNHPDWRIVSLSPERFLRRRGDRVETSPIKGTRPRGDTPAADRALAEALARSHKDRAEHLMIVDLERNDLGRVCRPGTVQVPERFAMQAHPTVWHLVSTVVGEVGGEVTTAELLKATFPGGSITGAPKIRAMEVIESLEPTRRGLYTGAIGYLGRDGDFDLNIAIRTALVGDDRVHVQVGGGVVADSDPAEEFAETLTKARAFFRALETESHASLAER